VVVIIGPSGSGKSTLLRCVNLLEPIQGGRILFEGEEITAKGADVSAVRQRIGIVFQQFNLFPHLTVMSNLTLAARRIRKLPRAEAEQRARELLDTVGLPEKASQHPHQLSGGQQQRVAIARALAGRTAITFADEPTGALDTTTALEVLTLLRDQSRRLGQTIVMVTHDPVAASYADRVVFLVDGRIVSELHPGAVHPTAEAVAAELAQLSAGRLSPTES
jgi:putative ABC transport system ATP-binding protein